MAKKGCIYIYHRYQFAYLFLCIWIVHPLIFFYSLVPLSVWAIWILPNISKVLETRPFHIHIHIIQYIMCICIYTYICMFQNKLWHIYEMSYGVYPFKFSAMGKGSVLTIRKTGKIFNKLYQKLYWQCIKKSWIDFREN